MAYKNPPTATDIIIEVYAHKELQGIVLIQRKNPPYQGRWALPGGFQEVGESLETTAVRESKEETGLDITLLHQLNVYSNPERDPRCHVNAIGYVARAEGIPQGGDDAAHARIFSLDSIPHPLAFDHRKRIDEYRVWKERQGHWRGEFQTRDKPQAF